MPKYMKGGFITEMDAIYKDYVIDLSCNNNFVQVPVVQGDGNESRFIRITLISNNVQYLANKETMIVSIAGTKPDGNKVLNECISIDEDGKILIKITSQIAAVAGRGDYSITLMDKETNSLLQSFPFYILTTKSAFNASEVVSSNEFQLLTKTVVDSKKAIDEMRELEAEVAANEEIRKQSEISREQEELARKQAETDREQAEIVREQAEQKRQSDTATAIQNVENATKDAIDATNNANQAIVDVEITIKNANTVMDLAEEATQNTINAINNANTVTQNANQVVERIENLEQSFTSSENVRVQNENDRIQNELVRQSALEQLNIATNNTVDATNRANTISEDLETKLASGFFNGKDGVDGKDGKDGIVMKLEANEYYFSVVDGDLILTYNDGT